MKVRTRFAPSPTGHLHIGGARTALFCYLYAKRSNGQFLLRVEDTDRARNTKEAYAAIEEGLKWLGLNWDEEIVYQSKRFDRYKREIETLLEKDRAYVCSCSVETLDEKRQAALKAGKKPMYDGTCRDLGLKRSDKSVIRFRAPKSGETVVHDLIKGDITYQNQELDDMIIERADGSPTYNFVVVVDDSDMQITHVLRGDDHLNNTPKQILIYEALEKTPPKFGHVPLILGTDKTRLSKRHGATAVQNYRDQGFLPEAMINFLVRLGWSCGDKEIFSIEELKELFDLDHVGKSAGIFNMEKLLWTNQQYLRKLENSELTEKLRPFINGGEEYLKSAGWQVQLEELKERCKTLAEFPEHAAYFFNDQITYDEKVATKFFKPEVTPPLRDLKEKLEELTTFSESTIEEVFKKTLESSGLKLKALAQAVRIALTGNVISPGIYRLIYIVGKERAIKRLDDAVTFMSRELEA